MKIRITKRKSMVLAAPKTLKEVDDPDLEDEEIEDNQGSEEISQGSEKSDLETAMEHRDNLVNALAKLTAKERLEVLKSPCNMTGLYSIDKAAEMLDKYSRALKGNLNEPSKEN